MTMPTLSAIMPNYNYEQYIGEALEAVLSQSLPAFEVIVVDDASTDNSVAIVEKLMRKYPNLKLLRNEKNMGAIYSLNRGLFAAKGDYFCAPGSDDKTLPGFFERSMGLLMEYPQAGLCFSDCRILDVEKDLALDHKFYLKGSSGYISPKELENILSNETYTPIYGPTVIFKRQALIDVGGYLAPLKWSSDAFAHHVVGFRYGACYIPEVLTMQRVHARQYSTGIMDRKKEREVIRNLFDMLLSPKYADVLPQFKRTAPISVYPWEVFSEAVRDSKYRGFISFKLLRFALYDKLIRQPLRSILPTRLIRGIIDSIKRIKLLARRTDAANRD